VGHWRTAQEHRAWDRGDGEASVFEAIDEQNDLITEARASDAAAVTSICWQITQLGWAPKKAPQIRSR
jgi:hypothetical protein